MLAQQSTYYIQTIDPKLYVANAQMVEDVEEMAAAHAASKSN